MTRMQVDFDGLDLNDGLVFKTLLGVDLGSPTVSFDEYRGYAGTVAQANVSDAALVQMVVPLEIRGVSVPAIASSVASLNAKIAACSVASPGELIFDGVTHYIVTSNPVDPRLLQPYQDILLVTVDLVLNRLPDTTGTPAGGAGGASAVFGPSM
jgi:hypothetical protein